MFEELSSSPVAINQEMMINSGKNGGITRSGAAEGKYDEVFLI